MRSSWALHLVLAAALVGLVAGIESSVAGGIAAGLRSCWPELLLAVLALLGLSFVLSRAAWIRSAQASLESAESGTAAQVLSGACACFAFLATTSFCWSLQISSPI